MNAQYFRPELRFASASMSVIIAVDPHNHQDRHGASVSRKGCRFERQPTGAVGGPLLGKSQYDRAFL